MIFLPLLLPLAINCQALIKHYLRLHPQHPVVLNASEAIDYLQRYFDHLPGELMGCRFSCGEFADPRVQPLCKYMANRAPGYPTISLPVKHTISDKLRRCVETVTPKKPLFELVEECAGPIYGEEDDMLEMMTGKAKASKLEGATDFMEGLARLVKDMRPLPLAMRAIAFTGMLVAVLIIAGCTYKFVLGGDYLSPVSTEEQLH